MHANEDCLAIVFSACEPATMALCNASLVPLALLRFVTLMVHMTWDLPTYKLRLGLQYLACTGHPTCLKLLAP